MRPCALVTQRRCRPAAALARRRRGGVLAVNLGTNGAQFTAYDGNGNVMALVSAGNGTETARYDYDPFGHGSTGWRKRFDAH